MAVRWGLVGASNIARQRVIGAIRGNGGTVASVFSRDPARGAAYARENAIPDAAPTLAALLDRVDAVYIATTNELHCEQTLAAAQAGRHVLCEKPLAVTREAAAEMIAACSAAGVVLATNHHLRSNAVHAAMRERVAAGAVGRPLFARVFNAGYLPKELHGWRLKDAGTGAGVVLDKLVHDVDTLRFVLGDEPVAVLATATNSGMAEVGIEDGVMGTIRFRSGLLAQFHDAFSIPGALTGLQVLGSEGSLHGSNCLTGGAVGTLEWRGAAGAEAVPVVNHDPYGRVIAAFHAAMRGEGRPDATGEDGAVAVAVALAARESARIEREVAVAPVA